MLFMQKWSNVQPLDAEYDLYPIHNKPFPLYAPTLLYAC